MARKSKKSKKTPKRRMKTLTKRVARDLEEMIALNAESSEMTKETLGNLLCNVGAMLAGVENKKGSGKSRRKSGRFLEYLNKPHGQVLEPHQLEKEEHDLRMLTLIKVLNKKKGKTPAEIAHTMRKKGNSITADGIRRILAGEE